MNTTTRTARTTFTLRPLARNLLGLCLRQCSSPRTPFTNDARSYERDEGRCSFVDDRGERCCETRYLELHHLHPFAQGGAHCATNLALRCAAHNRLAAETDFGPARIAERRYAARHESLSRQLAADARGG